MRAIMICSCWALILSGCHSKGVGDSQNKENARHELIKELAGDANQFNYHNVEQGYYEDVYYFNDDVNSVVLDFEIFSIHDDGKWLPLNSFFLEDQSGEQKFYVKYVVTAEEQYLNIRLHVDGDKYFDEDFPFKTPISQFEVEWYEREVQIRAAGFEYAMGIPFDVNRFGNGISSMEVINKLTMY